MSTENRLRHLKHQVFPGLTQSAEIFAGANLK